MSLSPKGSISPSKVISQSRPSHFIRSFSAKERPEQKDEAGLVVDRINQPTSQHQRVCNQPTLPWFNRNPLTTLCVRALSFLLSFFASRKSSSLATASKITPSCSRLAQDQCSSSLVRVFNWDSKQQKQLPSTRSSLCLLLPQRSFGVLGLGLNFLCIPWKDAWLNNDNNSDKGGTACGTYSFHRRTQTHNKRKRRSIEQLLSTLAPCPSRSMIMIAMGSPAVLSQDASLETQLTTMTKGTLLNIHTYSAHLPFPSFFPPLYSPTIISFFFFRSTFSCTHTF